MMMTIREVALRVGKSHSHLSGMCKDGALPATRVGIQWLMDEADLPRIKKLVAEREEASQRGRAEAARERWHRRNNGTPTSAPTPAPAVVAPVPPVPDSPRLTHLEATVRRLAAELAKLDATVRSLRRRLGDLDVEAQS
jgi:excisionase family DNA binding protein